MSTSTARASGSLCPSGTIRALRFARPATRCAAIRWKQSSFSSGSPDDIAVVGSNAERKRCADSPPHLSRRAALGTALSAAVLADSVVAAFPGSAHASPAFQLGAGAGGVATLLDDKTEVRNPGVSFTFGIKSKQLYYPDWMEGEWDVAASFRGVQNPLGRRFMRFTTPGMTKASIITALPDVGAGMEEPVRYTLRFVRGPDGVTADRVFNITSQVNAFLRSPSVEQVEYEPSVNPTRLAVTYSTPRKDVPTARDLRKAEIFVNNRKGEMVTDTRFAAYELFRQVNQARNQGSIGDYMVINEYRKDDPNTVYVQQRVAAFCEPQSDPGYFEAGDRAIALYDYNMTYTRVV